MSVNINLPSITATDAQTKIEQIQSYIYQLVQQLNWAFSSIDTTGGSSSGASSQSSSVSVDAQALFGILRPYIMASSDIVTAYAKKMKPDNDIAYAACEALDKLMRMEWSDTRDVLNELRRLKDSLTALIPLEGEIRLGGFTADTSDGIAIRWTGR